MTAVLLEGAVTPRGWAGSFGGPAVMAVRATACAGASSFTRTALSGLSVGASLIAFMVTAKVRLNVLFSALPSSTVTVTDAVPLASATGVKVSAPVLLGLL